MSLNNNIQIQSQWTKSTKGEDIALYRSENFSNNPILIIGGVHGDEHEGVFLCDSLLEWLKGESEMLRDWTLIPQLNPDGLKNNHRTNGNNVDLNRNYPSSNWSSEFTKDRYFPGKAPATEPEIKALVHLIKSLKPSLIIHCHSWEPCIVSAGPKDLIEAKLLANASGYELKHDIGYPTPGSLSDYAWKDLNIPVICIEEREGASQSETWNRFGPAFKEIMRLSKKQ